MTREQAVQRLFRARGDLLHAHYLLIGIHTGEMADNNTLALAAKDVESACEAVDRLLEHLGLEVADI